jgi:hypothetical protein
MNFLKFETEYLDQPSKYEVVYVTSLDFKYYEDLVANTDRDIIFWKHGETCDYVEFEKIIDSLQKKHPSKKFVCIFNDYRKFETPYKYIPSFGWWGEVLSYNWPKIEDIKKISNTHKRKKLFISRNRIGKDHRRQWVSFLRQNDLFDSGYVSVGWENKFIENTDETYLLNPILKNIPYDIPALRDFNLLPYYEDVFTEVVTESGCDPNKINPYGHFDSEKVWRPFLMCVIPMIITYPNYDDYLKDVGFDMFDDVIDTSFYSEIDVDEKIKIINKNFQIIQSELVIDGKFEDSIWDRLKKNQERFLNYDNYYKYIRDNLND